MLLGEHFARNEKAMLRDPDGWPVLRGVRTEIAWAEKIRETMLSRFAAKPKVVEMLKSIDSAGWFVLNRDNLRVAEVRWKDEAQDAKTP